MKQNVMQKWLSVGIALVATCGSVAAKDQAPPPAMAIPRIAVPEINGEITPGEWDDATRFELKFQPLTGEAITTPPIGYLGRDDDNLYFAFDITEPDMAAITAQNYGSQTIDVKAWGNECVEIYLTPGPLNGHFTHFVVDVLNQKYDAWGSDPVGYNPQWQHQVVKRDNGWSVEIAIPISAASQLAVNDQTVWRINCFRNIAHRDTFAAWTPTYGTHDQLVNHGYAFFGSPEAELRKSGEFLNELRSRMAGKDAKLDALLNQGDSILKTALELDVQKAVQSYPTTAAELAALEKQAKELALQLKLNELHSPVMIQSAEIFRNDPPAPSMADLATGLEVVTLRGESNDYVWNITNRSEQTITVRMAISDQKSPLDDFLLLGIPGFQFQWGQLLPVATHDNIVVYDALEHKSGGLYTIAPGETVGAVLEVTAFADAELPETVTGNLVVQVVNDATIESMVYPVTITVIDRALTEAPQFYTFCWDTIKEKAVMNRPEFLEANVKMLADYGFNMGNIQVPNYVTLPRANAEGALLDELDFSVMDAYLDQAQKYFDLYYVNIGMVGGGKFDYRFFAGTKYGEPGFEIAFKSFMSQIIDHLLARGIPRENIYINPYDEVGDDVACTIARWIKEINPDNQTILDCYGYGVNDSVRNIRQYTDVWMPHHRALAEERAKPFLDYLQQEKELHKWLYYYCTSFNEKVTSPYQNYLIRFWSTYFNEYDGLAYWAAGQYYGDPWYRKTFPRYDTSLMYPVENGVTPSRRLLAWRRGVADRAILALTEEKLRKENPDQLKNWREELAQVIQLQHDESRGAAFRLKCKEILKQK